MQYPTVIETQIDTNTCQAIMHLQIQADLIYFAGHFPDFPLLPGVVQLDWAIHYAKLIFGMQDSSQSDLNRDQTIALRMTEQTNLRETFITSTNIPLVQIEQLKFTQAILPDD